MVGGVTRRCDSFNRPAVARNHLAVPQHHIRPKVTIGAGVERIVLAYVKGPRGAMRTFGEDRSTGRLLDGRHRRRMVPMRMRHKNVRDGFIPHGVEQCADMSRIVRAGIDDRDLPSANDVADGALERERAGIVGHDPAHARHRLVHHIGCEVEVFVERECLRSCRSPDCGGWPITNSAPFTSWQLC